MKRFIRLNILAAVLACGFCVPAAVAESVESRVEVTSRGDAERQRGAILGLFELLQERYPPDHPLSASQRRDISGDANNFLQRYGYLTDADGKIILRLQFDERAIDARVQSLLSDAPDAVAGLEPALLWLIVTQGATELMLTEGAQGVLPDTLDQIATALAQPLVYPRDGVMSDGTVSADDIRNVNVTRLESASRGYAAGHTVVLSMQADGDEWLGNWTLLSSGEQWTSMGPLATMLQVGLTAYQGRVAALEQATDTPLAFGTVPGDITVAVAGVGTPSDYAWLSSNLRGKLPGLSVKAVSVGEGEVVFVIGGSGGDVAGVAQGIAALEQLQFVLPEPTPVALPAAFGTTEDSLNDSLDGIVLNDGSGAAGDLEVEPIVPVAAPVATASDLNYLLVR